MSLQFPRDASKMIKANKSFVVLYKNDSFILVCVSLVAKFDHNLKNKIFFSKVL